MKPCACYQPNGIRQDPQRGQAVLRRSAVRPVESDQAPEIVHAELREPGQPLDAGTRAALETRLGQDFSQVRVHTSSQAAQSARAVRAAAYTVGHHIAFAEGRYAPQTTAGQRLLAHELTHVIQQGEQSPASILTIGAESDPFEAEAERVAGQQQGSIRQGVRGATLQRTGEGGAPVDVAIVLDDDEISMAEGRSYARTVLRVTSAEDAKNKIKALGGSIGTLYVVSHSSAEGKVKIVSAIGTISWVPLADFAKDLKGAFTGASAPQNIDFRGCQIGRAGGQLENFRSQVGAKSAQGSNCWSFVQRVTPLTINGVDITREDQVPQAQRAAFDRALRQQVNGLKSADGHPVRNCIIGLSAGEQADRSFDKIKRLYFQNSGTLVASWFSPEYNENWQDGSICGKDMTESTNPCKIVKTARPAGGRQGAIETQTGDTRLAGGANEVVNQPEEETAAV